MDNWMGLTEAELQKTNEIIAQEMQLWGGNKLRQSFYDQELGSYWLIDFRVKVGEALRDHGYVTARNMAYGEIKGNFAPQPLQADYLSVPIYIDNGVHKVNDMNGVTLKEVVSRFNNGGIGAIVRQYPHMPIWNVYTLCAYYLLHRQYLDDYFKYLDD